MLNPTPVANAVSGDTTQRPAARHGFAWALLSNEWRFYRVQPLFWLVLLLALAFAALVTIGSDVQTAQPDKELLLSHTKLLMLLQPLFIGALAPLAFLRDRQFGMAELTGATPLSRQQWCVSRAGGLLVLAIGLQLLVLVLAAVAVWLGINPATTELSFSRLCRISMLLFLLQQLPALLLLVTLQLWCSRSTSQVALLYLLTAVCCIGYLLLASATGSPIMARSGELSPWLSWLMLYLDPYALSPWLAQLQNTTSMHPGVTLLLNRLLMIGLSALLLWRALRAKPLAETSRINQQRHPHRDCNAAAETAFMPARHSAGAFTPITPQLSRWQSFSGLTKLQWQQLLRQRSTILALLLLYGLILSEVLSGVGFAEMLSRLEPDSRDALNRINWDLLPRIGIFLVAFWASQLSWLNRQQRCDSLIASTPVDGWVQQCSQLASLWLATVLLVVLSLSAVALAQLLLQIPLQPHEYLQQGLFALLPLLLWGLLILACHALLRSPLQANALVVVLLLFGVLPTADLLALSHPLWRIGQTQLQMPDALWAYQGSVGGGNLAGDFSLGGFWPYLLFWAFSALTLWLLALPAYHRGTGFSRPQQRLSNPITLIAAGFALLGVSQGLHIHQQLQRAGALETAGQRQAQRAAYEQQFQHWQQQPQPQVQQVQLHIDLNPHRQQAQIKARLTLRNPHPTAIKQLLLTLPGHLADRQAIQHITVTGAQPLTPYNDHPVYQFSQPLAPGASAVLTVQLQVSQQAIAPSSMHQWLRAEFSYLRLLHLLPHPGYMPEMRLRDNQIRSQFGLAALTAADIQPSVSAATATPASARYDWAPIETVLAVPSGYQGITAGKLIRSWQQNNRQFFHYRTEHAIRNLPAVIAVPWQPQTAIHQGISLEIYSPYYNDATTLSMQAIKQTLQWFDTAVGAYPGDALRLVMMPDIGQSGYALPQLVLINHRVGLRAFAEPNAGFSQVYRRVVHEVAHQWFGHGIGNGVPGDGAFLVESLAKYAELVLIEQHFGRDAMLALVDFERQRYQRAMAGSRAEQKSLLDADESYDQYSRATLVFALLRTELGDALITQALRQLWQQHRYPATPASAMDFVRMLLAISPADKHGVIQQLLLEPDNRLLLAPEPASASQ
jgi:ABC-type transport system involved in multi-copper enzyme maturation permease subunit